MSFTPYSGVVLTSPASIDAALAHGGLARPAGVPLELWLASLADEVPEVVSLPPHPDVRTTAARTEEMHMASNRLSSRTCSREGCANNISAANRTGVCTPCQQGRSAHLGGGGSSRPASRRPARASKPRDADDEVLDRTTLAKPAEPPPADEAPPASEAAAAEPPKTTWFDRFVQLHQALGLDPHEAIEEHCRAWVEETTERALGGLTPPAKAKPRQRAKPNGANGAAGPLDAIGEDYERARQQAEAGRD